MAREVVHTVGAPPEHVARRIAESVAAIRGASAYGEAVRTNSRQTFSLAA